MEYHIPVLWKETIEVLNIKEDGIYVDCTLGGGGHSEEILKRLGSNGRLIAIDQDDDAINFSKKRLEKYKDKFIVFKNNFSNIDTVLYLAGYDKVDGILMDIGVSSYQLDTAERGFSYKYDAKLDMRMNQNQNLNAYKVVNEYDEEKLSYIIYHYGEERFARKIANNICEARKIKKIETTFELVEIIKKSVKSNSKKHPAKKTFQALRIEVNQEFEVLEKAIDKSVNLLKSGGRLAIITFHSLEDKIVKAKFRELEKDCICPSEIPICVCNKEALVKIINKKAILPSEEELKLNKRCHSSQLRFVERL